LFIATGTVKHHLSHAYAKLGVNNRMQLAAVARERRRKFAEAPALVSL